MTDELHLHGIIREYRHALDLLTKTLSNVSREDILKDATAFDRGKKALEEANRDLLYVLKLLARDDRMFYRMISGGLLFQGTVHKFLKTKKGFLEGKFLRGYEVIFQEMLQSISPRLRDVRQMLGHEQTLLARGYGCDDFASKEAAILKEMSHVQDIVEEDEYHAFIDLACREAPGTRDEQIVKNLQKFAEDRNPFWTLAKIIATICIYLESVDHLNDPYHQLRYEDMVRAEEAMKRDMHSHSYVVCGVQGVVEGKDLWARGFRKIGLPAKTEGLPQKYKAIPVLFLEGPDDALYAAFQISYGKVSAISGNILYDYTGVTNFLASKLHPQADSPEGSYGGIVRRMERLVEEYWKEYGDPQEQAT